jgi:hypothetical protein
MPGARGQAQVLTLFRGGGCRGASLSTRPRPPRDRGGSSFEHCWSPGDAPLDGAHRCGAPFGGTAGRADPSGVERLGDLRMVALRVACRVAHPAASPTPTSQHTAAPGR